MPTPSAQMPNRSECAEMSLYFWAILPYFLGLCVVGPNHDSHCANLDASCGYNNNVYAGADGVGTYAWLRLKTAPKIWLFSRRHCTIPLPSDCRHITLRRIARQFGSPQCATTTLCSHCTCSKSTKIPTNLLSNL